MLRLVICIIFSVQIVYSNPTGVAEYSCNADQTIYFSYPQATPVDFTRLVVASQLANSPTTPCQVTDTTDGGSLTTTIDATTQCSITVTGGAATVKFYLTVTDSYVTTQDFEYTVVCDFNSPTVGTESVTFTSIQGVPNPATNAILKTETATLDIVSTADEAQSVSTCTLADTDLLKLRLELTTSATAYGIRAITCTASPDNTGTPSVDIITASCGSGFVGTTTTTGFKKSPGVAASGQSDDDTTVVNAKYVSIMTAGFHCFRFNNLDTLYVECTVAFCRQTAGDLACDGDATDNTCATKPATINKRKRRATNTTTGNIENEKFSVTINVGSGQYSDVRRPASSSTTHQECSGGFLHQTTFIVTVTILAVLLVLSMGATVYVAKKSRFVGSNPPPYLAKGADNPAF